MMRFDTRSLTGRAEARLLIQNNACARNLFCDELQLRFLGRINGVLPIGSGRRFNDWREAEASALSSERRPLRHLAVVCGSEKRHELGIGFRRPPVKRKMLKSHFLG